jgi:hypothetical protein
MISKSIRALRTATACQRTLLYRQTFCFGVLTPGKSRMEKDTFGPIEVPGDKYWGA